jgi:RND family efflux transporter MFP subunit
MKKINTLLVVVLIGLTIFSACAPEVIEAEETVKETPIEIQSMKKDTVEYTYVAVGEVVPIKQMDIYVAGGGYIESLKVGLGDIIEKDMLLIELDGNEVDRTNYNATESQLRTVRDNLASQLDTSRANYERQLSLFEKGIVTALELDQSLLQVQSLEREYANARSTYRNQLAIIESGLEDFSETRIIKSSVEGVVAGLYVEEGEQANGQIGLSIIDNSGYYIRTSISGSLKKALSIGEAVRLRLDGREDQIILGTIDEIQDIPDNQSKLYEVMVAYEGNQDWILGDYVEVEFILEQYEALLVPAASIVRKGEDQYVYTYKDDTLSQVLIEVGRSKDKWIEVKNIEVISGVVVRGQDQLQSEESAFVVVE